MLRALSLIAVTAILLLTACAPGGWLAPVPPTAAQMATPSPTPLDPSPVPPTQTPLRSTATPSPSPVPTVRELKAVVSADRLSCRYGPGPEYLYLYGLRKGANIVLIGRTDGNNWVWVAGRNNCWVNARFIEIQGKPISLPVAYPEPARLPRSPYYPATAVTSAIRSGDTVTVDWIDVPLRPGDEEDESMLRYIVEVWRCQEGQIVFDPLATNATAISFIDQPGCSQPSHGRVFVQEKHGFAGPAEIPWPK